MKKFGLADKSKKQVAVKYSFTAKNVWPRIRRLI